MHAGHTVLGDLRAQEQVLLMVGRTPLVRVRLAPVDGHPQVATEDGHRNGTLVLEAKDGVALHA